VFFEDRDGDTKIKTESMTSDPDSLEVLQRNYYYPFGMEMEGPWQAATAPRADYLYNGKEWNEDLNLDWYDYGARYYDPSIGRWNGVDPLAEKYAAWSPYSYTFDNPIRFIDPDGRAATPPDDYFDENGNYLYTDTKTTQDVRIIKRSEFERISSFYGDALNNRDESNFSLLKELEGSSQLLSELNISPPYLDGGDLTNSAAVSIVNYYYQKAGYDINELQGGSAKKVTGLELGSLGYNAKTDQFSLSVNREDFGKSLNNRSDFLNFIAHERGGHGPDWKKYGTYNADKNFWEWERRATRHQVTQSSWKTTSLGFKKHIYEVYGKHEYIFSKSEQKRYFENYGVKIK
jgi:RHS repeat-associated protein